MEQLTKEQLTLVYGGLNITGIMLGSFIRGISVFLDLGRSFGTAIRRIRGNNLCPL